MINKILRNLRMAISAPFRTTKPFYRGANNKTVKILANGPSLKADFESLTPTDEILVLNNFFLHEKFYTYKPHYYAIVDPMYFEEKFWVGLPNENIYNVIVNINWDITFFIPYKYYSYFRSKVNNPHVSIKTLYRFPFMHRLIPTKVEFILYRLGISCPTTQNVLIPSIYAMINMGYRQIYLYGTDHSWTSQMVVNNLNQVCLVDSHFYDTAESCLTPWLKANGNSYKMHEILKDLSRAFYSYHELSSYASYVGDVTIINKTKKSFIDAFCKDEL